MKRRTEFWQALLGSSGPTPELVGAFALGLLVVGLFGNLLYDVLASAGLQWADLGRVAGAALILVLAAYGLYLLDRRRQRNVEADVDESRLAPAHAGLIWLLGPGRFDHLLFAIRHHRQGGGAAHCWLVMQNTVKVQQAFAQLSQTLTQDDIPTQLHPVYLSSLDAQSTYQAVRAVFDREAQEEGLPSSEVIADITGGTKPLTAGMVLATITADRQMEYVESERDAQGEPIPNTLRVVLIDADFTVSSAE